jgi:hypothetical protein
MIQRLRIKQTSIPPIRINPYPQILVRIPYLLPQELQLAGRQRRAAAVEDVERVVGEGLHVLQVGGVACGAGGFEGVEDVVARVAEDPVAVCGRRVSLGLNALRWAWVEKRGILPDPRHAGPSVLGLLEGQL